MTFSPPTPEELLKRAMDALDKAEARAAMKPERAEEWALVSRAASHAGMLAVDILETQPRIEAIDDLSGRWQDMVKEHGGRIPSSPIIEAKTDDPEGFVIRENDPRVVEGRQAWVNPDEWETLLALRTGAATVHVTDTAAMHGVRLAAEAPETPAEGRTGARRGRVRPRDLDQSDVDADADRMQMEDVLQGQVLELGALIRAMMIGQDTVSVYIQDTVLDLARDRDSVITKHPRGGVSIRLIPVDDTPEERKELTEPS